MTALHLMRDLCFEGPNSAPPTVPTKPSAAVAGFISDPARSRRTSAVYNDCSYAQSPVDFGMANLIRQRSHCSSVMPRAAMRTLTNKTVEVKACLPGPETRGTTRGRESVSREVVPLSFCYLT